jgi:alpha-mannosidase
LTSDPEPEAGADERLTEAWRWVCFNQFHDTLGGSSIPSAYGPVHDQLGSAKTIADETMQFAFRRQLAGLPADPRQRIALLNASDAPFDGWLSLAPWTEARWEPSWGLVDEAGAAGRYQLMQQEALTRYGPRVVIRTTIEPGALQSLFIDRQPTGSPPDPAPSDRARATPDGMLVAGPVSVAFASEPALKLGALELAPELILYEDTSDTWSHGLTRYEGAEADAARWDAAEIVDTGPLLAAALQPGRIGDSDVAAEWRVHAGGAAAELLLSVDWRARHKILKLVLRLPEAIAARTDGVLGGAISRHGEKRERPLRDFTLVHLASGGAFGVVCPDVFAIDADEKGLRLTLLRSPFMAHHEQIDANQISRRTLADQGPHRFRFQFLAGEDLTIEALERRALMLQRPPLVSDWTNGMTSRSPW